MKNRGFLLAIIAIVLLLGGYFFLYDKSSKNEATKNIKIGVITPLSGNVATYGEATRTGIDIALKRYDSLLNANEITIEIIYEDSRLDQTTAVNAFSKLANSNKVKCILGPFGSSNVLAVAQNANNSKIPILSASATADDIQNAGDYVFRNVPSNNLQGTTLAKYVLESGQFDKERIAIYYLNNDYGISLSDSFEKYVTNNGGRILLKESFETGQQDFRTSLQKIKSANPSFIYAPDHYNEVGIILKQAKELGINIQFGGGDGSYSEDLINIAGSAANGFLLTLMGTGKNNNELTYFKNRYNELQQGEPDVYSIYAYDAMSIYIKTILDLFKNGEQITSESIKEKLYDIRYEGATGTTNFDSDGEVKKLFSIYKVSELEFKPIEL